MGNKVVLKSKPWATRKWRVERSEEKVTKEPQESAPGENHHLDLRHTESDKDPGEKEDPVSSPLKGLSTVQVKLLAAETKL